MEVIKEEGDTFLSTGKYEDAISQYTKAIEIKPIAALYINRSLAYLKLEKFYEAHCDAKDAIRLEPLGSKVS